MTSKNVGKIGVSSNVNDMEETALINAEDDFIKKLKDLKNSLGRMLSDEAPPESNLVNIKREMSEVLEKRFGEVERLHEKVRVRDLIGREKVKKIQDYHRKTTAGAADDKDNALLEVKKARKRLKLITKNNEEELLPDYIGVMQELISMLRTTKRVVRGIKDEAIYEEKILGSNDPKSGNVYSTNPNSRDQIEMENFVNSQLKDRESGYGKQDLKKKMKNLKRSSKWMDIDRLDSDSIEDLMEKKVNFEDKLRNNLKKQSRSRDDRRGLGGSEIDSFEDEETWMTKKQKKKKEKEKKKWKGSFGRKVVEDL
ncbi:hypothetical protein LSTR_LSTR002124 [Laodelphax striatellus]|uniref:Uncharacterized protein n=1 Tax=Laodelphax striatellus TaxID=195883 RepID=A0A482XRH3_LAOST|nr:hypothetical protein LSTR_LSTR002124 [Laodelphax striatellus]